MSNNSWNINTRPHPEGMAWTITLNSPDSGSATCDAVLPQSLVRSLVEQICRDAGLPAPWRQ